MIKKLVYNLLHHKEEPVLTFSVYSTVPSTKDTEKLENYNLFLQNKRNSSSTNLFTSREHLKIHFTTTQLARCTGKHRVEAEKHLP